MKSPWFSSVEVGDMSGAETCVAPLLAALPQRRRMIHNTMLKAGDKTEWELEGELMFYVYIYTYVYIYIHT